MAIFMLFKYRHRLFCGKKDHAALHTLTESVKAIRKGDARRTVPVETGDEIGNTRLAFNA